MGSLDRPGAGKCIKRKIVRSFSSEVHDIILLNFFGTDKDIIKRKVFNNFHLRTIKSSNTYEHMPAPGL